MNHFAAHLLCNSEEQRLLLDSISQQDGALVCDVVNSFSSEQLPRVYRTLSWLAKLDAVRVANL
jgi:hypothetical protein